MTKTRNPNETRSPNDEFGFLVSGFWFPPPGIGHSGFVILVSPRWFRHSGFSLVIIAVVPMALVSILYWLSLATWFGSAVFLAVAAPMIIRTVREHDPLLPTVLSVNLERQHSALLAGSIVRNLLASLTRLSYLCSGGLLIALIGEWVFVARGGLDLVLPLMRSALFIAATVFMVYDARFVRPRIEEARRTFIDHADEPDVANPALDRFERYGRESVTVLQLLIFVLLGLVVFSAIGLARGAGQTVLF